MHVTLFILSIGLSLCAECFICLMLFKYGEAILEL